MAFKQLSIVIPIGLNDLSWQPLLKELSLFGEALEIILVACQIKANNQQLPANVVWIKSDKGRAKQLNAGAKHASRDFIWFVHADTQLTTNVAATIKYFIKQADEQLGFFTLKFADDGPIQMSVNAWGANIRSRLFSLPFGDQGFIIKQALFKQFHGFDESVTLGEDLDFVIRLQAENIPIKELPAQLMTSARRYQQYGWLMTTTRYVYLTVVLSYQAKQRLKMKV